MKDLVDLQKKLYPDLLLVMQQRYFILHSVDVLQPIGRRGLAENTNLTERIVRSEVDFLQGQGLIEVTSKGMYITKEGKLILDKLVVFMSEVMGLSVLENRIKDKLQIEKVIVIPGDSDKDEWVKHKMGDACISFLKTIVEPGYTLAVAGGTTIAAVAEVMTPLDIEGKCLFVPARGGIDERVENQANTIVVEMAKKAKGDYRLLYVPDPLSETTYQTIINEPSIREISQQIQDADIVLHGIGDALTMANRRKAPEHVLTKLKNEKAVSEAFGYYFNDLGNVVHHVRTVGIRLEDLANMKYVITVAGGKSKGKAIASYFQQGRSDLLITDEAAAEQILKEKSF